MPPTPLALKVTSSPGQIVKVFEPDMGVADVTGVGVKVGNALRFPTVGTATPIVIKPLGASQATPLRKLNVTIRNLVGVTIPVVGE